MKYRTDVNPTQANSSQAEILRQASSRLQRGASILDVGCASGDLGAALTEAGFVVTGIEADPRAAAIAAGRISAVVEADVNELDFTTLGEPFDAIVFGDVLEHLARPEAVLARAMTALADNGSVIASIPNVAHGAVRLALLQGRWTYTAEGLLDATHLHFFTLESAVDLLHGAGLSIDAIRATILEVLGTEVAIDDAELPGTIVEWVRDQPNTTAYQFIFVCQRDTDGASANSPIPEIIPIVPLARPQDEHAHRRYEERHEELVRAHREQALARAEALRYDNLTMKDHVVALEGEMARMRFERDKALEDIHQVRMELIETHARLADALAHPPVPQRSVVERAARKAVRNVRGIRR